MRVWLIRRDLRQLTLRAVPQPTAPILLSREEVRGHVRPSQGPVGLYDMVPHTGLPLRTTAVRLGRALPLQLVRDTYRFYGNLFPGTGRGQTRWSEWAWPCACRMSER